MNLQTRERKHINPTHYVDRALDKKVRDWQELRYGLLGVRMTRATTAAYVKKGDYFLIDFLRLEAE